MQPEAHAQQPQHPRRKKAKAHIAEEEASAYYWVVSYADMLMVLMSFFIIYFEMDSLTKAKEEQKKIEVKKPNTITQLVMALKDKAVPSVQTAIKDGSKAASKTGALQTIATALKGDNVQLEGNLSRQSLTVAMRDNLFRAGQFELRGADLTELRAIMRAIFPFIHKVRIVVLGHTDDVPIVGRAQIVDTNFVLSTLRATKAAQQAVLFGIPQDRVSAEAAADSARKTRSLSIKVILDQEEGSGKLTAPSPH